MDEKFRQMVEDAIKTDIRNANEAFLESLKIDREWLKIDREWLEANQTGGWAR